jgi:DNA-directed RNA polymerase subunit beta
VRVFGTQLEMLLDGHKCAAALKKGKKVYLAKNTPIEAGSLAQIPVADLEGLLFDDPALTEKFTGIGCLPYQVTRCQEEFEGKAGSLRKGRRTAAGRDQDGQGLRGHETQAFCGRQDGRTPWQQGRCLRILPVEDMPYFADGRTVDMVLNPLGVPSRMNVGQILEIHLGLAAKGWAIRSTHYMKKENQGTAQQVEAIFLTTLRRPVKKMSDKDMKSLAADDYRNGVHMATPVFDGAKEEEIKKLLVEAGLSPTGQTTLYDGRTGEAFKEKITVGHHVHAQAPPSGR